MTGRIGIICDNYKLDKFKERLDKENLVYTTEFLTQNTTLIAVRSINQPLIKQITDDVTQYFIDLNKQSKHN